MIVFWGNRTSKKLIIYTCKKVPWPRTLKRERLAVAQCGKKLLGLFFTVPFLVSAVPVAMTMLSSPTLSSPSPWAKRKLLGIVPVFVGMEHHTLNPLPRQFWMLLVWYPCWKKMLQEFYH